LLVATAASQRVSDAVESTTQELANARLLAAAPDLLDALQDVATSGIEFEDDRVGYITIQLSKNTVKFIRATIAKATEGFR